MKINAILTWLALIATWVWISAAYINGTAALRLIQHPGFPICEDVPGTNMPKRTPCIRSMIENDIVK